MKHFMQPILASWKDKGPQVLLRAKCLFFFAAAFLWEDRQNLLDNRHNT